MSTQFMHLTDSLEKYTVSVENCQRDHEMRLRAIEQNWIKAERMNGIDQRIDSLDKTVAYIKGRLTIIAAGTSIGISVLLALVSLAINHLGGGNG